MNNYYLCFTFGFPALCNIWKAVAISVGLHNFNEFNVEIRFMEYFVSIACNCNL